MSDIAPTTLLNRAAAMYQYADRYGGPMVQAMRKAVDGMKGLGKAVGRQTEGRS